MASILKIQQGVDTEIAWPITDANNQPADLTGYSAQMQVRSKMDPTSTLLKTFEPYCDGDKVKIYIDSEETYVWAWKSGYAALVLLDPDGIPTDIVWNGRVVISLIPTRVVTPSLEPS